MYKVIEIIEPDFGCEGLPDGEEPMCEVILEADSGKCITVTVPDKELYEKNITEGCYIDYTNSKLSKI
ncbi:MAG: hypothetical protein IJ192_01495 [Clostridia bacterium]|nr:hypothetical protein [Clostridia bacterium]